jgi:glutamine amidotransferase
MGGNTISGFDDPLFAGIARESYVYFVSQLLCALCAGNVSPHAPMCRYFVRVAPMRPKDNFRALQFHPEKSGPGAKRILRNFLAIR